MKIFPVIVALSFALPAFAEEAATPVILAPPKLEQPLTPRPDAAPASVPSAPSAAPPATTSVTVPPSAPVVAATPTAAPVVIEIGLPGWVAAVMVLFGALMAGAAGIAVLVWLRREERAERRHAVAATLALELDARYAAFAAVPVPPNAEAGISFVSSVAALAGFDAGFRAVQTGLDLLPAKIAANLARHYAEVSRIATFVKGQSMAAAVRMLQVKRMGGQPTPDAAAMRDAHVALAEAFNGIDKLVDILHRLH